MKPVLLSCEVRDTSYSTTICAGYELPKVPRKFLASKPLQLLGAQIQSERTYSQLLIEIKGNLQGRLGLSPTLETIPVESPTDQFGLLDYLALPIPEFPPFHLSRNPRATEEARREQARQLIEEYNKKLRQTSSAFMDFVRRNGGITLEER